nr:ribonuclease H-like domain-containing protein [Tanacetum cinerariifolium]
MDPYNHSTPISIRLPILDTGKFEQWKFIIQQYLQHEHYALWEFIEFGDSYKAPPKETAKDKGLAGEVSASTKKKGRTVAITAEDMQKRKNDTFGGNEATKKTKKNKLKQQYGNFKAEGSEILEQTFNRLQAIEDETLKNHALVADEEEVPTEYALMAKSSSSSDNESPERDIKLKDNKIEYLMNELEEIKTRRVWDLMSIVLSHLLRHKSIYLLRKDLSWMGLPEFVNDTVTDYTRPTPSIDVSKSVSNELEERWKSNNPSLFEQGGSSSNVMSKPMIKFVKESGCPNAIKVNNTENARKPTVKYAEMYRNTLQSPRVRGNQRNWNNQKSQQLGKDFMMQNKACYNCGSFDHLEFNCKHDIWVDKRKTWTKINHA